MTATDTITEEPFTTHHRTPHTNPPSDNDLPISPTGGSLLPLFDPSSIPVTSDKHPKAPKPYLRWLARVKKTVRLKASRGALPPRLAAREVLASFLVAWIGLGIVAAIHYHAPALLHAGVPALVASFGASAVLIYGTTESPLAQPRCVIGGQVLSAFVGISVEKVVNWLASVTGTEIGKWLFAACGFSVAASIALMQITRTTHPPGGATALIPILNRDQVRALGYLYVASPVLLGSVILLCIAVVGNNACGRPYPQYWLWPREEPVEKEKDAGSDSDTDTVVVKVDEVVMEEKSHSFDNHQGKEDIFIEGDRVVGR